MLPGELLNRAFTTVRRSRSVMVFKAVWTEVRSVRVERPASPPRFRFPRRLRRARVWLAWRRRASERDSREATLAFTAPATMPPRSGYNEESKISID